MMADSLFTSVLRMACAFMVVAVLTSRAQAASTFPTVAGADSVFIGRVMGVSEVTVAQRSPGEAVWKAEIALESVEKSDVLTISFTTVYFSRGFVGCPMPPNLTRGMRARFFCERRTVEGIGGVLWIPESGYVEAAPVLPFEPLPLCLVTSPPSFRGVSSVELAICERLEVLREVGGRLCFDFRAGPPVLLPLAK